MQASKTITRITFTHTRAHTPHTLSHPHAHLHMHTHTPRQVHTPTYTHAHTYMHTYTHTKWRQLLKDVFTHKRGEAHIRTQTHSHTYCSHLSTRNMHTQCQPDTRTNAVCPFFSDAVLVCFLLLMSSWFICTSFRRLSRSWYLAYLHSRAQIKSYSKFLYSDIA